MNLSLKGTLFDLNRDGDDLVIRESDDSTVAVAGTSGKGRYICSLSLSDIRQGFNFAHFVIVCSKMCVIFSNPRHYISPIYL